MLFELFAHTFCILGLLQSARAVSACAFKPFPDCFYNSFILIHCYFHCNISFNDDKSFIIIVPRFNSTKPSAEKDLSIRVAASLAELIFCVICSWVIRSVLLPVRSDSETRNSAKRLSRLVNIICCIDHITSEKRFTASSYKKHFIFIFLSFNSAIALAGTM